MKRIIIFLVSLVNILPLFSQIKATTENGTKVLLFDNGTWVKEEKQVAVVGIDSTLVKEIPKARLFMSHSEKMARHFGKVKGKVGCDVICKNNSGEISVTFQLGIFVGDGYKYFGGSLQDCAMDLKLADGQSLRLIIKDEVSQTFNTKTDVSFFRGSVVLNNEQISNLIQFPVQESYNFV